MNYEIVEMKEKTIVGVNATTSNSAPDMGQVIGKLWTDLYQGGVGATVKNKANDYAIGLYSDYVGENYQVTVGYEVSKAENAELTCKVIPAGRYAKFNIHGDAVQDVGNAWGEIWNMDLDRSYACDYEEYLTGDCKECDINIYIALK